MSVPFLRPSPFRGRWPWRGEDKSPFWDQRLFFSAAEYGGALGAGRTLASQSVLQALGWSNAQSTSNPPATVIGRDGNLQYAAHNLQSRSETTGYYVAAGTTPPTINAPTTLAGKPAESFTLPAGVSGYSNCRVTRDSASFPIVAGTAYAWRARVRLSRALTGSERVTVYCTGSYAIGEVYLTAANSGAYTGPDGALFGGSSTVLLSGMAYFAALPNTALSSPITIDITEHQVNYGSVALDYVPTEATAVYGIPITHDRGACSNYVKDSADLNSANWIRRGAATAQAGVVRSNGVVMSLISVGAPISRDIYQHAVSAADNIRYEPGVWIEPVSATGQLIILNSTNSSYGRWEIDLSKIAGPTWVTRDHPSVTIVTEFLTQSSGVGLQIFAQAGVLSFYIACSLQLGTRHSAAYLRTFGTAPLFTAGTPTRQNLIHSQDFTNTTVWSRDEVTPTALGNVGPDGAPAYRLTKATITPSLSVYMQGSALLLTPGTTYTLYGAARAGTLDRVAVGLYSASGYTSVAAEIVAGAGTAAISGGLVTISNLLTAWTIVRMRCVAAAPTWASVIVLPNSTSVGDGYVDVATFMLHEGTHDLPFTPEHISEYPQAGIQTAETRTRETLHPRDLTQASWTKTNVTAAKTALGVTGAADSATTLTATAANGTVLQAITSASANRAFSAHVRSRSASNLIIDMTCDGGTTWQAVTVNAAFMRCSITQSAVTNPSYGFRLRASGDSIDVDFVQGEIGSFATPPIWGTESAAQTRSGTQVTLPASTINDIAQTTAIGNVPSTTADGLLLGRAGFGLVAYWNSTSAKIYDGTNGTFAGNGVPSNVFHRIVSRYSAAGMAISLDGSTVVTAPFDGAMGNAGAPVGLGHDPSGAWSSPFTGLITSLQIAAKVATDAQLQDAARGRLP